MNDEKMEGPAQRTRRVRRLPWAQVLAKLPGYLAEPKHGDSSVHGGGSGVQAILGPGALNGSAANPNLPRAIAAAKRAHPETTFIAGHILNGEFGGDGQRTENLTILTSSGNGSHKKFDNNVKYARAQVTKVYGLVYEKFPMIDLGVLGLGVWMQVMVSPEKWGEQSPDCYICRKLVCAAKIVANDDAMKHVCQDGSVNRAYQAALQFAAKASREGAEIANTP